MKTLLEKLRSLYRYEAYFPGVLGLFINPFYFARKGLANHISNLASNINGKTLDVGCGSKPYESLYTSSEYVGLEYDTDENRANKKANFFYDGHTFPFENGEFDSVVANEVFEHVFNPEEFLGEIHRVLKDGGSLLMTMPFVWDEHEQPFDYARYSSFGIRNILERHEFEIITQRKSMDDVRVIFQMLNVYIYKKTVTSNTFVNIFLTMIFIAPLNLLGELLAWVTPRNPDLYLDNIVLARKVG